MKVGDQRGDVLHLENWPERPVPTTMLDTTRWVKVEVRVELAGNSIPFFGWGSLLRGSLAEVLSVKSDKAIPIRADEVVLQDAPLGVGAPMDRGKMALVGLEIQAIIFGRTVVPARKHKVIVARWVPGSRLVLDTSGPQPDLVQLASDA
jgi:hypothetical protein